MKIWNFFSEFLFFRWLFGHDDDKKVDNHVGDGSNNGFTRPASQSFDFFHEEQDDFDSFTFFDDEF